MVRNGKAWTRQLVTGSGTLAVRAPRVNDRRGAADGERHRFSSQILPSYMRRAPKVTEVLPILYLRGLSTGDFQAALPVLLGEEAGRPVAHDDHAADGVLGAGGGPRWCGT